MCSLQRETIISFSFVTKKNTTMVMIELRIDWMMSLVLDEQMVCLYSCVWLCRWYSRLIYDLTFMCCDIILQWQWWFCAYLRCWIVANSACVVLLCFELTCQERPTLSQSHPYYASKYATMLMTGLLLSSLNPSWNDVVGPGRADSTFFRADPF